MVDASESVDAKKKTTSYLPKDSRLFPSRNLGLFSQLAVAVAAHRACVLSIAIAAPVVGCFWAALFTLPIGTGVGEGWGGGF